MSWNSQGGGPWGGGGNNNGGRGNNPWGGGGGGGQGGGPNPPDIEEMLRKGQDRFKKMVPSGGPGGARIAVLGVLVLIVGWFLTGIYTIKPGQQGVELLFGEFVKTTNPGLNYWPPSPIGEVSIVDVNVTQTTSIGFAGAGRQGRSLDRPEESLMITGDQNIVDMDFVIQWNIKDVDDYLFNILDPETSVKVAAESAMREIVGRTPLEGTLTQLRGEVQSQARALLQDILDSYGSGINILDVKLQKVDPPQPVIDAFNDVQRAKQDQERSINEATAYANDILPRAKGEAQRMIQGATAYKERVIAEADGDAQRFLSVFEAYKVNKEVTKRRIYLERMQQILSTTDKIIIDQGSEAQGVVPYLPLNELKRRSEAGGR